MLSFLLHLPFRPGLRTLVKGISWQRSQRAYHSPCADVNACYPIDKIFLSIRVLKTGLWRDRFSLFCFQNMRQDGCAGAPEYFGPCRFSHHRPVSCHIHRGIPGNLHDLIHPCCATGCPRVFSPPWVQMGTRPVGPISLSSPSSLPGPARKIHRLRAKAWT